MLPQLYCHMKQLSLFVGYLLVFFLAAGLLIHRNLYPVPNPDIFHYAIDGQTYMSGSLPENIHVPPGSPLIIGFLSKLPGLSDTEVAQGIWINILSTIGCSVLLLLIVSKISFWLIVPVLLVVTINPLAYIVGVDTTSEALFSFMALLSLWFLSLKKFEYSLLFSWLSFFVRYAGAGLILGVVTTISLRKSSRALVWIMASIIVVGSWLLILNYQNDGNSILDTVYMQEIIARQAEIPHLGLIERLMKLIVYDFLPIQSDYVWIWPALIICGLIAGSFTTNKVIRAAGIFSLLYIMGSLSFPNYAERYSFPLIWTVPLVISYLLIRLFNLVPYRWVKLTAYGGILLLSMLIAKTNYQALVKELNTRSRFGAETRATADWLNRTSFEKTVIFLTLESWKLSYYVENPHVHVMSLGFSDLETCSSMMCIADLYRKNYGRDVDVYLDITHVYMSEHYLKDFWLDRFGIRYFYNFGQNPDLNGGLLRYSWQDKQSYAMIYEMINGERD
jgi:hypothetical protein